MIVYALVARGRTVLAEFTSQRGNFSTVTRALLSKIPAADGRMSYVCDDHVFHYQVADGITYLCMADQEGKRRIAFAFLEDVKRRFESNYGASKRLLTSSRKAKAILLLPSWSAMHRYVMPSATW